MNMGIFDWLFGKKKEYDYKDDIRRKKQLEESIKRQKKIKELERNINNTTLQLEDFKDPEVIEFSKNLDEKYKNSRIKPSPRQIKKEWDEFVIKYKEKKKTT